MSQSHENFGKYILLEKLAMGGMAEVYLGRNSGAGGIAKFIAIKRILPQFSENAEFIDMFKDEAKIAINISHSNIVSIYEFGMEKGQFFLVMDYVEGRNLRQILNKMKKSEVTFSIEQVLFIVKEVAAGLDAAHRCLDNNTGKPLNIIHRDMSPQNIMISFEGEVKIVDFGIAKAETQLETTRAGTLKGKFGYMSPEQAEGHSVDLRTDIFSLGIVLWELLANDRLFIANNEVNTLRKIRDCQIPSLRKINPNIPQELERIVNKSLAKDRNQRYQTGAAFHRDLSRFLNRQYPDFSPQDFSVFVKTLFSSEILETRKKMIEYAKIDMSDTTPSFSASQQQNHDKTIVTQTGTFSEDEVPLGFGNRAYNDPPLKLPTFDPLPGLTPNENTKTHERITPPAPPPMRVREHSITGSHGGTHHGTYTGKSIASAPIPRRQFPFATFMTFLLIATIGGVAYYSVNNPQQAVAFLQSVGILDHASRSSTEASNSSVAAKKFEVAVSSSPPGAAILVDGKPTRELTPARLVFEEGTQATITVRLAGYIPHEETIQVNGPRALSATLRSDKRGYIDVNVIGAGEISINGKVVAQGSPANDIAVPADEEVLVSVVDPITKAQDSVRVTVAANSKKKITLIPRAVVRDGTSNSKKQ